MKFSGKIIFINSGSNLYGSEQSLLLGMPDCMRAFVCPGQGQLAQILTARGEKVFPVVFNRYSFKHNPFWHIKLLWVLLRIFAIARPDVLVVNLSANGPVLNIAAKLWRMPVIRFERFEIKRRLSAFERWLAKWPDIIIFPSEIVRGQFKRHQIKHSNLLVWYDPIPRSAQPPEGVVGEGLCYVGRIQRGKRIETAIQALSIVRVAGYDICLKIVGAIDESPDAIAYQSELYEIVRLLKLCEYVHFEGFRQNAAEVIAGAAICVLPSESESFGRVLAEAWVAGVPTICADVGGSAEITQASGGGVMVPVGDAVAMARAIANILSDVDLSKRLGRNGKRWVEENCSPVAYQKRFEELLETLNRPVVVV